MKDTCNISDPATNRLFGALGSNSAKILNVLGNDISVQLFADRFSSLPTETSTPSSRKRKRPKQEPSLELFAVLYGPFSCFEAIGHFAAKCNVFLQHPRHCNQNVPYRNPQCLSDVDNKIVKTYDLADYLSSEYESRVEEFTNPIDFFADAREQEALACTESPKGLRTQLYEHQKQALTFMLQRETGWAMNGHHRDLWKEERDAQGRMMYLNTITGQRQGRFPPQFRGGLLIDAPGLGKSLSIIALLLCGGGSKARSENDKTPVSTTLLIIPKTPKHSCSSGENIMVTNFTSNTD